MKIIKLVTENTYLMGYNENNVACYYYPITKEAKELDLPLLPPFEEVDIEKEFNNQYRDFIFDDEWEKILIESAFNRGYKAAQSNKQFTLEDMKKAIEMAREDYYIRGYQVLLYSTDEIIQSLSTQQLPKEFIISDKFSTFEENIKNGEYKW